MEISYQSPQTLDGGGGIAWSFILQSLHLKSEEECILNISNKDIFFRPSLVSSTHKKELLMRFLVGWLNGKENLQVLQLLTPGNDRKYSATARVFVTREDRRNHLEKNGACNGFRCLSPRNNPPVLNVLETNNSCLPSLWVRESVSRAHVFIFLVTGSLLTFLLAI